MAIAKARCTCKSCGNTFEFRKKCLNRSAADSFEKWAVENITECSDCKAARIQSAHDAENEEAAKTAMEMGYPVLNGTERQVSWANSIREKIIKAMREFYLAPQQIEKHPEAPALFDGLTKIILGHTSAGWWIENMNSASKYTAESAVSVVIRTLNRENSEAMDALKAEIYSKQPEQPTVGSDEETAEEPRKLWYAIMMDDDDTDWGTGCDNLEDAIARVKDLRADTYPDAYIAVIDDTGDPVCIDEIRSF